MDSLVCGINGLVCDINGLVHGIYSLAHASKRHAWHNNFAWHLSLVYGICELTDGIDSVVHGTALCMPWLHVWHLWPCAWHDRTVDGIIMVGHNAGSSCYKLPCIALHHACCFYI